MKPRTVWTLFFRLVLLILPFAALFLIISVRTAPLTAIQQARIQDKVQRLIFDDKTEPKIIFAGDSRAADNVMPQLFTKESGLETVNVAAGAEVLSQAYDTLNSNGVLNHKRLILISVTAYDISDTMLDAQPLDKQIIDNEPWSKEKIKDLLSYYKYFLEYYVGHFRNVISFNESDNIHMTPAVFNSGGFDAQIGGITLTESQDTLPNPDAIYYDKFRAGGLKQADFIRSLKGLGATNDTVVVYIGPTAPLWDKAAEAPAVQSVDKLFAQVIKDTIAPYPNMHFIDFQDQSNPTLTNDDFFDRVHLNPNGAAAFTTLMVNTLEQQGLLPKKS